MKPGELVKISDTGLLSAGYTPTDLSSRHGVVIDGLPITVVDQQASAVCFRVLFNEEIEMFYAQDLLLIKE